MVIILLEAGAEVNVRSNYGETPLSIAEEYQNPNIFALLREYDAVE
jgi:ankyrin repeat protein